MNILFSDVLQPVFREYVQHAVVASMVIAMVVSVVIVKEGA